MWQFEKIKQWWRDRSLLEQMLLLVTLFLIILNIILMFQRNDAPFAEASVTSCTSPICLRDSAKILLHANVSTNPCDDFYQFTCGNFLENANRENKLPLHELKNQELLEMYKEPILSTEHKMVTTVKKLFQSCADELEIERTAVETIKEVLQLAGGWPALVGSSWDPDKFDWVNSTYKLRQLGYYYTVFMNLQVVTDPDDENNQIYQISTTYNIDHYRYGFLDLEKIGITDVAIILGAEDEKRVSAEMTEVHELALQLQIHRHNLTSSVNTSFLKFTVYEYQQQCGIINWLQFINTLAGPTAKISKNDYVLFPPSSNLTDWLDVISGTPKRIQANYMMWKVIEAAIPYLTRKLRSNAVSYWTPRSREDFCMEVIENEFIPNPVEIMLNRRYVSMEKQKEIKELVFNIKQELLKAVNRIDWMKQEEKHKTAERLYNLTLIIAQPGNYFDDKIFDELNVDMMELENDNNFLNLLAQASRNHQTMIYNLITKAKFENILIQWHGSVRFSENLPTYYKSEHTLYVPGVATVGFFFHEKRPQYLNYGALGSLVAYHLSNVVIGLADEHQKIKLWSNATKEIFKNKTACLEQQLNDYQLQKYELRNLFMTHLRISQQISYAAYRTWINKNKEGLKLIGVNYTPKQLFWISAVSTFCGFNVPYPWSRYLLQKDNFASNMLSRSLWNNKYFVKDFSCPRNSKMNSSTNCAIL